MFQGSFKQLRKMLQREREEQKYESKKSFIINSSYNSNDSECMRMRTKG